TKDEIAQHIAEKARLPKHAALDAVDALLELIGRAREEGRGVKLGSYCTLYWKETPPRKARNPRTGEEVQVPARYALAIKRHKLGAVEK
ncbi:MAG: HU family DNA-binding protein, partial [Zetaproteobacteria bacterium]